MSKHYEEPLDLVALACAGLLEPEEIEAAEAACRDEAELHAALGTAFEALAQPAADPQLPSEG